MHNLFPNSVRLNHETHQYFDDAGREYLSVSKFIGLLYEKFEDSIAYKRANEETKKEWKNTGVRAANHGTNIHEALELYNNTGQILEANSHLEPIIKDITSHYSAYHKTYDEICLYSKEWRIAGTTDKLCALSNRSNSEVDIADFKNWKSANFHSDYRKRMYAPIDHLQECNYIKASIQLSVYAYLFEELTGRRVRDLFIHHIPPEDMTKHRIIPVIYLKNDIKDLLKIHKDKILRLVEPQIVNIDTEYEF